MGFIHDRSCASGGVGIGVEHAYLIDVSQSLIVMGRLFKVFRCIGRSKRLSCYQVSLSEFDR